MDAIRAMRQAVEMSLEDPQIIDIAKSLQAISSSDEELYQNLANFVFKSAYFEADPPNEQRIRTAKRLLQDSRANCVDYTVFICTVLAALNKPCLMRAVVLPGQNYFGHIYPVSGDVPIDVVPQQDQEGKEFYLRDLGQFPKIGTEIEYEYKLDTPIP